MPVADIGTARDLVYAVFKTAWATLGTPPQVVYDDQEIAAPEQGSYAEVSILHKTGAQVAVGACGGTRWRSQASLIVDLL